MQTRSRQGRNVPHEENESRYYSLKVFGSNLLLNLTRSKVLGSGFVVENRHENGSRLLTTPQIENHFTGNVVSYPGSIIFLSVGSGLVYIMLILFTVFIQSNRPNIQYWNTRSYNSSFRFLFSVFVTFFFFGKFYFFLICADRNNQITRRNILSATPVRKSCS